MKLTFDRRELAAIESNFESIRSEFEELGALLSSSTATWSLQIQIQIHKYLKPTGSFLTHREAPEKRKIGESEKRRALHKWVHIIFERGRGAKEVIKQRNGAARIIFHSRFLKNTPIGHDSDLRGATVHICIRCGVSVSRSACVRAYYSINSNPPAAAI